MNIMFSTLSADELAARISAKIDMRGIIGFDSWPTAEPVMLSDIILTALTEWEEQSNETILWLEPVEGEETEPKTYRILNKNPEMAELCNAESKAEEPANEEDCTQKEEDEEPDPAFEKAIFESAIKEGEAEQAAAEHQADKVDKRSVAAFFELPPSLLKDDEPEADERPQIVEVVEDAAYEAEASPAIMSYPGLKDPEPEPAGEEAEPDEPKEEPRKLGGGAQKSRKMGGIQRKSPEPP